MAGSSAFASVDSLSKDNLPLARYIVKGNGSNCEAVGSSLPLAQVPVIDLSCLEKGMEDELEKLKSAVATTGCFQAVAHGIPIQLLEKIDDMSKQFFKLSSEEKQKYLRAAHDFEGYGTDPVFSEEQVLDWSERLFLKLLPHNSRNVNMWPSLPNDFRRSLDEYSERVKSIIELVLGAMSRVLNLEEDYFLEKHGDRALMNARFNYYPTCPWPDLVLGAKAHSDGTGITVLLQDNEVEGLQIKQDGQWFRVPIISHALVINIGDQMQIMSNDIFKSPMHRVTANAERTRTSLAIFYLPDPDIEIEPASELINEERPQVYRKLKNYGMINLECFQKGKVPLETVRF